MLTYRNGRIQEIQSEHQLQKAIVERLRSSGFFVVNTDVCGMAVQFIHNKQDKLKFISHIKALGYETGCTDLVVIGYGHTLLLELKFEKGRLSPEQKNYIARADAAGIETAVWRTVKECMDWIVQVTKEHREAKLANGNAA